MQQQNIYMYLPGDAIDEKIVSVEAGYSGSSKDNYYWLMGVTIEASRLWRKERACGCQPCFKLQPGCSLTRDNVDLMAGLTAQPTARVFQSARQEPEARHTRNARPRWWWRLLRSHENQWYR